MIRLARPGNACRPFSTALVAATLAMPLLHGSGAAEDYPARPIRLVAPTGAGGTSDSLARFIGAKLSERLHQSVVIENRPGARTMIGNEMVSHAPPDGYTLLWGASDMTMLPMLLKSAAHFDPSRNLTPIALAVSTWGAYAINPKLPAKNLTEFVAYAKANPGKLHYGTNGTGGSLHVAVKLLEVTTGIEMIHVPYKATVQVAMDVMAGEIDMASLALSTAATNQTRLRVLAQTAPQRSPTMPDVPTTAEAGFPQLSLAYWFGLFAPPDTPADIVNLVARELKATLSDDSVQKGLAARGAEVTFLMPDEFTKLVDEDKKKWRQLVPAMGLHAE
jgi:tripartite-type tricarboxylate transporter receptor subunit TctC